MTRKRRYVLAMVALVSGWAGVAQWVNRLNLNLLGRVVILDPEIFDGDEDSRRFICTGGFGCFPETGGTVIYGRFIKSGQEATIRSRHVLKVEGMVAEKGSEEA